MSGGNRFAVEPLESRQLLTAEHPVAINFNDEAMWNSNFATAINQATTLGVTAVRVWIGFSSYDQRPNAWDAVPAFGDGPNPSSVGNAARTIKNIFELARDGFSVLVITNPDNGVTPTGADEVKGWIRHLMDATETPTSTTTLADIVEYWEIGNEPDSPAYWQPSGVNKTAGLKSYVDNFLIPAAEELHSNAVPEKVVSAGVSYSPADLKTILDELAAKNAIGDIDYVGFHPYGNFDPSNPAAGNQVLDRTLLAKTYASAYGKSLIATEWNVRGFGNSGANDAQWAAAIDYEYRTVIEPNYSVAYYFALINNWSARGGSTSARPGGLLEHQTPITVTPSSSTADLTTYYNSPLVAADPFYTTFSQWQTASVSGTVAETSGGQTSSTVVYLDANNNGQLDAGEASTTTAADGSYSLSYSISSITPGANWIRIVTPTGYAPVIDIAPADLQPLTTVRGVNFSVTALSTVDPTVIDPTVIDPPVVAPPVIVSTLGIVAGRLWLDADADGKVGVAESLLSGWTVYLDLDGSGTLTAADPQAITNASGKFVIAYDTSTFTARSAALRVSMSADYAGTSLLPTVPLTATAQNGVLLGVYHPPASISGFLWNDGNGDGLVGTGETRTGSRVVFIDANRNGKLDAGERQSTSDANGNFSFQNLAAGTYYVSRVFPTGFHLSNATTSYITVTVAAGQNATGANIGTTDKAAPVVKPPVMVPPVVPPVVPVVVPPVIVPPVVVPPVVLPPVVIPPVVVPPVVVPPVVVPPVVIPPVVIPPVVVPSVTPSPANTGTASISGAIFARVGTQTKSLLSAGLSAYIDSNNNGRYDAGEVTAAVSTVTGTYSFANLAAGTYTIAMMTTAGWNVYTPGSKTFVITLTTGRVKTGQNFVTQKV